MSGRKYDQDKAPIGRGFLGYFMRAIEEVALVSKFGKEKYETEYEDKNWAQVEDARLRYRDAAARHLTRDAGGEYYDPESGLPHTAHAAWCLMASLELDLMERGGANAKIEDSAVPDLECLNREIRVGDRVERVSGRVHLSYQSRELPIGKGGIVGEIDEDDNAARVRSDSKWWWAPICDLEVQPKENNDNRVS